MARKMHCAFQDIGNDNPKVSEAGTDFISTIYQQRNKFTSLKDCQESSLPRNNSDSGCAIITFFNFESDGNWRIVAIPAQCLNHINLASGMSMDGLQLLFPPPLNRLKIDQCKGPRGPLPPYAYSVKSFTRSFTGSNVRRRCQNKIANRASKLNELPESSSPQSSLVSSHSLFPDSSSAVSSSDKFTRNTKVDKSLKKNSRKRTRKKVRQSKKQLSDSGSTEREVLPEEYVCVSLTSETCSSNDVDKEVGVMMYTTAPEYSSSDDRLTKIDCKRNEMNDNINVTEAPKSCNSCIDEAVMPKATAPTLQKSAGECATFESKNQLQDRGSDFAVVERETKDIPHVDLSCFSDTQDSLVLDSVSIDSKSDESTNADDIGKHSNKGSCRITSNSGDGYFLSQNLMNGVRNNHEHNEGIRHGGQSCVSNDKRVKQKRTMSKSSSFNKFGGVGTLHGRTGKENSHSVWQKVQKNSSDESGGDLKKVNSTVSHFVSTAEKEPSVIKNSNPASANVVSKLDDKKHLKVCRKSKGKMDLVSKKGHCNYSRKDSHFSRTVLNGNEKASVQQNDLSHISSHEINQQGLSSISGFNSDINYLMDGFQTNRVEQETSEIVNSVKFHQEESDIQKGACPSVENTMNEYIDIQDSSLSMPGDNMKQSNISEEQSLESCNLSGDEVGQTVKGVSSTDYNAQNHSSGSTLWKWIPVGKKDTGLGKSESNSSSPENSDEPPNKNFNLETSVEPKMASCSQNQDASPNASNTCMSHLEGENHKLDNEVACSLTEQRDKHEVANHMINECEHQDMLENDYYRIAQAVNDACREQLACEAIHMATGGPVAEFERLLHFCSPVICQSSANSLSCLTCSQDHSYGVSLCRHEMPALSLGCLWQWYEKHGSYGLEIRAQDGGVDHFPFRAYFVPSLSAIQLFKNHENECVNNSDKVPNCKFSEACEMIDISEHSSAASQHSINSLCSGELELLFEYFEYEQPQQRWPLYEKIQELVRGDIPNQSKIYGDPTKLDSINLRDLHPRSWFSVAWYPIYRIPDGNFRASFLTYHSLGHLVRRSTNSDSPTIDTCIVSPAVGLQSYNAQGECWFQLSHSALAAEMCGINTSILLKERLRTLEETASLMARAVVKKGNKICTNRHPDYEFFLSRRRY